MTSEWQPIETAPKDGTDIIFYDPASGPHIGYWSDSPWVLGGAWVVEEHRSDTQEYLASHWMPLPPPPGDE